MKILETENYYDLNNIVISLIQSSSLRVTTEIFILLGHPDLDFAIETLR